MSLQKIVYLSENDKNILFTSGSITKDGTTINYSDDDLYITPELSANDSIVSNLVVNDTVQLTGLSQIVNQNGVSFCGDDIFSYKNEQPVNTGKKWVDDKYIWRKVWDTNVTLSAPSSTWYQLGSIKNLDTLIDYHMYINDGTQWQILNRPYSGSNTSLINTVVQTAGNVLIQNNLITAGTYRMIIFAEYTRTDDATAVTPNYEPDTVYHGLPRIEPTKIAEENFSGKSLSPNNVSTAIATVTIPTNGYYYVDFNVDFNNGTTSIDALTWITTSGWLYTSGTITSDRRTGANVRSSSSAIHYFESGEQVGFYVSNISSSPSSLTLTGHYSCIKLTGDVIKYRDSVVLPSDHVISQDTYITGDLTVNGRIILPDDLDAFVDSEGNKLISRSQFIAGAQETSVSLSAATNTTVRTITIPEKGFYICSFNGGMSTISSAQTSWICIARNNTTHSWNIGSGTIATSRAPSATGDRSHSCNAVEYFEAGDVVEYFAYCGAACTLKYSFYCLKLP